MTKHDSESPDAVSENLLAILQREPDTTGNQLVTVTNWNVSLTATGLLTEACGVTANLASNYVTQLQLLLLSPDRTTVYAYSNDVVNSNGSNANCVRSIVGYISTQLFNPGTKGAQVLGMILGTVSGNGGGSFNFSQLFTVGP